MLPTYLTFFSLRLIIVPSTNISVCPAGSVLLHRKEPQPDRLRLRFDILNSSVMVRMQYALFSAMSTAVAAMGAGPELVRNRRPPFGLFNALVAVFFRTLPRLVVGAFRAGQLNHPCERSGIVQYRARTQFVFVEGLIFAVRHE